MSHSHHTWKAGIIPNDPPPIEPISATSVNAPPTNISRVNISTTSQLLGKAESLKRMAVFDDHLHQGLLAFFYTSNDLETNELYKVICIDFAPSQARAHAKQLDKYLSSVYRTRHMLNHPQLRGWLEDWVDNNLPILPTIGHVDDATRCLTIQYENGHCAAYAVGSANLLRSISARLREQQQQLAAQSAAVLTCAQSSMIGLFSNIGAPHALSSTSVIVAGTDSPLGYPPPAQTIDSSVVSLAQVEDLFASRVKLDDVCASALAGTAAGDEWGRAKPNKLKEVVMKASSRLLSIGSSALHIASSHHVPASSEVAIGVVGPSYPMPVLSPITTTPQAADSNNATVYQKQLHAAANDVVAENQRARLSSATNQPHSSATTTA